MIGMGMRGAILAAGAAASLGLLSGGGYMTPDPIHRKGEAPRRAVPNWSGNDYTPNGKREVARRLRQIQNGQLKVSV